LWFAPNAGVFDNQYSLGERVGREDAMLFAFGAAGVTGLLLGLRYRVSALLVASGLTVAICLLLVPFAGLTPLSAVVTVFALPGTLQVGYLIGLILSCAWSRGNLWLAGRAGLANSQPRSQNKMRAR
jgi:hypothetical protein